MTQYDSPDDHFKTLEAYINTDEDSALVKKFAPRIRFDKREPFFPLAVGFTIFRETTISSSFPRQIELKENIKLCIEYAIWWDWDIQHLYEVEHIWIYIDANKSVVRVDASWHGGWNQMLDDSGQIPLQDGRVTLYSEPGKHAFSATLPPFFERRHITERNTSIEAGLGGVLVTELFEGIITTRTPINNRVAQAYLQGHHFQPTYEFTNEFLLDNVVFVPWETLSQWIPDRVKFWVDYLQRQIPYHERPIWRIAHRGASAHTKEGSASSIEMSKALGADMVEVDLRFTRDNVPVIFHDSSLMRIYGINQLISDLTLQALMSIIPEGKEAILTFEELVARCKSLRLALYLDIKDMNADDIAWIYQIVESAGMREFCIFASFRADWIAEIKANFPKAITSILFSSIHVDPVLLANAVNADYVHPCFERFENPHELITGEWLQRVRDSDLGVICWHEERPAVIKSLFELGVDGICSDRPELLKAEYQARQ